MSTFSSSSAQQARQALANQLRDLRVDAGLTARALAAAAGWDRTKISQIEHARRPPSAQDIRRWCRICGADEQATDLVESLRAAEGMWVEWRRMERTGLRRPQGVIDDVDAAVAVRMERQRLLHRGRRTFAFLIEESVLRAGIGGPAVMAGQLRHLIDVAALPSVSLGVVPAGPSRNIARPVEDFWIFDSERVSVELVSGYLTITQPHEIAMYAQVFATMTEIAVYGARARELIETAVAALA